MYRDHSLQINTYGTQHDFLYSFQNVIKEGWQQVKNVRNSYCYVQTCHQIITGRNLRYSRALKIIQSEEYLNAADTEAETLTFRRHHRGKRQVTIADTHR